MLKPIIISYKLTTWQFLYLTNTYKHREYYLQYTHFVDFYFFVALRNNRFNRVS